MKLNAFDHLALLIEVLFTPGCWLQNGEYSREWEEKLWDLMEKNTFKRTENTDGCTAMLGDTEIWVANHPYASFTPVKDYAPEIRPSRRMILFAKHKLDFDDEVAYYSANEQAC